MPSLLFSPDQHAEAEQWLAAFTRRYHDSLTHRPVHPAIDRVALRALMSEPLPRVGQSLASLFDELEQVIVPNATHTAHPRFLPYVQPSPNDLSPCADHVTALLNQNCNLWHLSPAANAVEQAVLRWFANLLALPDTVSGIITSGGSMANMIGLTAARDHALGDEARATGLQGHGAPLVLYASDETHSSVDKAVAMLGLGTRHLRRVPTDGQFRIDLTRVRSPPPAAGVQCLPELSGHGRGPGLHRLRQPGAAAVARLQGTQGVVVAQALRSRRLRRRDRAHARPRALHGACCFGTSGLRVAGARHFQLRLFP
jgi:hypothetical protein